MPSTDLEEANHLRYVTADEILVALDLPALDGERGDGRGIVPVILDLGREAPSHRLQQLDLGVLAGQQRLVRRLALQARGEAHPRDCGTRTALNGGSCSAARCVVGYSHLSGRDRGDGAVARHSILQVGLARGTTCPGISLHDTSTVTDDDGSACRYSQLTPARPRAALRSTFIFIPVSQKLAEKFTFTSEIPPLDTSHDDVDQGRSGKSVVDRAPRSATAPAFGAPSSMIVRKDRQDRHASGRATRMPAIVTCLPNDFIT